MILNHKGYTGTVNIGYDVGYDGPHKSFLHGRVIGIDDKVTYEGDNIHGLILAFKEAVDEYTEYLETK